MNVPNVNLNEDTLKRLFGLKKAYTVQTGEEPSFDEVVDAACDRLEEEPDFELARRIKEQDSEKDNGWSMSL